MRSRKLITKSNLSYLDSTISLLMQRYRKFLAVNLDQIQNYGDRPL